MTPEAREIMAYLKKHNLAEQLNLQVNKLCKKRSDDPFGFLSSQLHSLAAPPVITKVVGREVLSACGMPAIEVDIFCKVNDNVRFAARGSAIVPAGGKELDEDEKRYNGKGTLKATTGISEIAHSVVGGMKPKQQDQCDDTLSKNQAKIGETATTAISIAICKAAAELAGIESFTHVRNLIRDDAKTPTFKIPKPMVQLIKGGTSGCNLQFSEILVYPIKGKKFSAQLEQCCRLYQCLGDVIAAKYGESFRIGSASGGYVPPINALSEALDLIQEAATAAGLNTWADVALAVAGGYWKEGYVIKPKDKPQSADDMIQFYVSVLKQNAGVMTLINPLTIADAAQWSKLSSALNEDEDLKAKNYEFIASVSRTEDIKSIKKTATGISMKVEDLVTVTQAIRFANDVIDSKLALSVGAEESGTNETFPADFAVGVGASYVKFGGAFGSQNVDKYNRLLQIETILQ
eukprot:CAMPEP_0184479880 /NCGR_PEP_ID=MMETSP0113_2-20130426/1424_1 /TAXON_ID=91329 /ORGANISM="Norrisiella sphaerica, Strain BC52" /LENGTH=461 /DNA_ID=CAMNT_0026858043 /DNA_START=115 /DNA_END=1500 /DNA_ORIENTATION=-